MGGENSEIPPETRSVYIESASFDAIRVSRTSRRLGINSEAAFRYARTVDSALAEIALNYIAGLLKEWCAESAYVIRSASSVRKDPVTVSLTGKMLQKILLTGDLDEASQILQRLGLKEISAEEGKRTFSVPPGVPISPSRKTSWRRSGA